ncbi:nitrogen regulation protein NR(I) [Casimicrobium huifangae]|jgi:two-component system nitrogen regulation response regulator GlnG|uniref:nitrogen regulation protein NR(I) n=1 Tax=Casimicrobium huifangae TaxID=2591109 RepID=UPI0012EC7307|nr:nitrogen regulation protein NR(I) [Casimicrobium huifangae]
MKNVWIVDDDRSIRWVLEKALSREGLPWRSFENAIDVQNALENETPAVLVSDVRMPGESGLSLLKKIKAAHPQVPVIVMTAFSDLDTAVQAFQGGAFEYLPKPFDVEQALDLIRRAAAVTETAPSSEERTAGEREMLGKAAAMQDVFRAIGRLSQSHVTVLITGESGTGKELVARALHEHSPRKGKPFIAINTAAIPKDLLESELFGHERGSFTGAAATRQGRFQQAEGGTLFLDEIGDMPADLQVRLLRVLQDGEYYRVGGQAPMKSNVRIIAATHQNLDERVRQGMFREDLLHRLNVVRLRLPPLRERREDVPLLMKHFLSKSAQTLGGEAKVLTAAAMQVLQNFSFPGNVRQLENICHWITVMAPGSQVDVADLPPEVRGAAAGSTTAEAVAAPATAVPQDRPATVPAVMTEATGVTPGATVAFNGNHHASGSPAVSGDWQQALAAALAAAIQHGEQAPGERLTREFETTMIRSALTQTKGRRIEASEWLGWGRNTLTRKIHEYGLDDDV